MKESIPVFRFGCTTTQRNRKYFKLGLVSISLTRQNLTLSAGIKEQVKKDLDDYINGVVKYRSYVAED